MNTVQVPERPSSSSSRRSDLRKLLLILFIAFAPLVVHDLIVPGEKELSRRAAIAAIKGYQAYMSPWVPAQCRFQPSCSAYGLRSIEKHGIIVGGAKTAWRILRCNPFTEKGTVDPP